MTISFNDYYYHSAAYVEMYPRYAQHSIILVATFSCNLPGSETCIHRLLRISTTVSRIVSCLSLCLRSYTPPRNRPVCFFNAFFPTEINLTRFFTRFLLRNLIRRLKKNKREIKYFLGLYIYIYSTSISNSIRTASEYQLSQRGGIPCSCLLWEFNHADIQLRALIL